MPELNERGRHNMLVFPLNYPPAMTFEEIAAALNTRRRSIFHIYARAIEKIRHELRIHPHRYAALLTHREPTRDRDTFPDHWLE